MINKFDNQFKMVKYIIETFSYNQNVSCIVTSDILEELVSEITKNTEVLNYTRIYDNSQEIYVITKKFVKVYDGEDLFTIDVMPLYNKNEMIEIKNDLVLVDDDLLEHKEYKQIICEELVTMDCLYEEYEEELHEDFREFKEFKDDENECWSCEYEQLSPDKKEYIDVVLEEILEVIECEVCLKDKLTEIFNEGYNSGSITTLLSLSDSFRDIVIERMR